MRVGFEHLGQFVLLVVSISFLRSPVLAILAIAIQLSFTLENFCATGSFAPLAIAQLLTTKGRWQAKLVRDSALKRARASRGSHTLTSLHERTENFGWRCRSWIWLTARLDQPRSISRLCEKVAWIHSAPATSAAHSSPTSR